MKHVIYKITNRLNGEFYIGAHSTKDINDGYMGSGVRISRSINKYGLDNFTKEILSIHQSSEEMYEAEKNIVSVEMISTDKCLNIKPGGIGGWQHINSNDVLLDKKRNNFRKYVDSNKTNPSYTRQQSLNGSKSSTKFKSNDPLQKKALTASLQPDVIDRRKKTLSKTMTGSGNPNYLKKTFINENGNTVWCKPGMEPEGFIERSLYLENIIIQNDKKCWFYDGLKNRLVSYSVGVKNGWKRGRS